MIEARLRPISVWPHPSTPPGKRRSRGIFKAGWAATLALLDRELRHLQASSIILGCGLREQDIRPDGWPRSDARVPEHPGVEVSFDGPHGRLVYATDVCERWEHNVRAIALGLEALRAVDRHGISQRGQQYAGWRQLGAGGSDSVSEVDRGRGLIEEHGSIRAALRATHPDHGGDPADFRAVQAARSAA